MNVELLYFDDCPNWRITAERLEAVAAQHGFVVHRRTVDTPEAAEASQFRGSPTILIDGVDPFATGEETFGLACRLYQTPEGPAGSPTIEQIEAVIDA